MTLYDAGLSISVKAINCSGFVDINPVQPRCSIGDRASTGAFSNQVPFSSAEKFGAFVPTICLRERRLPIHVANGQRSLLRWLRTPLRLCSGEVGVPD